MGDGGGIKTAFLEEELETQQWKQAGLDSIGGKAGSHVSKDKGPSQCSAPHAPPCVHPVLPLRQESTSTIVREMLIHKYVAMTHHLEPEEQFRSFFQTVETLDEQKR